MFCWACASGAVEERSGITHCFLSVKLMKKGRILNINTKYLTTQLSQTGKFKM